VLLVHLITFRFSFPSDKDQVPERVMRALVAGSSAARRNPPPRSASAADAPLRQQYLPETNVEGYRDAREDEVQGWTGDQSYPVTLPLEERTMRIARSVICTAARIPAQRRRRAPEWIRSRMSSSWQAI